MKFSVLLPTRNGAPYLRETITSVLSQPYEDMELVVSDNASDLETQAIIASFASDKRLKAIRQAAVISVTENWNRALEASQGDYLVMIGDDDCLMPGFFEVLDAAIRKHGSPDCITYNGFSFVFPSSVGGNREAYYASRHFRFGDEFRSGSELPIDMRAALVRDMFAFKVRFPLNMQLTLFSRQAAHRIHGGTFQPPFPDHYALMSLLLLADKFVYLDDRLVVVGVSPKSFGHYYYSGQSDAGARYLGLRAADDGRLPGSELLNCMREWLGLVKAAYPDALRTTEISDWSYVGRQVYHWTREFEFGRVSLRELTRRAMLISWRDRCTFVPPLLAYRGFLKMMRAIGLRGGTMFTEMWPALRPLPEVQSMNEFVSWAAAAPEARDPR
ncbi:MAG TPA: glycosyltransferase family A protein [Vicinamibacterales bacterium]|nr:glycosyltransferase family A protein [Vicinamibacterales bacterium]